jgi:hypothetical protein
LARKLQLMAREAAASLERVVVDPVPTSAALVTGVALLPCVIAGLILFRLVAVEMLVIGMATTMAGVLAARLLRLPSGPLVAPALVGIGLLGASAPVMWAAIVAALVVGIELARARAVPGAKLQVGLLAYALALLASHSGVAAYVTPGLGLAAQAVQAPIDPVRLYVGNVPGPIFATSLLAVAIGAAWMWYSRRLSLLVVMTFTAGAALAIERLGMSPSFVFVSGPLWFAGAIILADRATLPSSPIGRPLMGLVAGALAVGARTRGLGVEAAPLAVATLQAVSMLLQGMGWAIGHRAQARARLRELWTARRRPELAS